MKLRPQIFWLLCCALFSTTLVTAQCNTEDPPTDFGITGETGINPTDSLAAIDQYVLLLLLAGVCTVYYKTKPELGWPNMYKTKSTKIKTRFPIRKK